MPIEVPSGVEVTVEGTLATVKGPRGTLSETIPTSISVRQEGAQILVERPDDQREHRALHGLVRSLVANMVEGVTKGYEKQLVIQGVGYRVQAQGSDLVFSLGYSHQIPVKAPEASASRWPARPGSRSRASTSSRWARWRPTSGGCASQTPTRARACATPARSSAARPARRPSEVPTMNNAKVKRDARLRRHRRVRRRVVGTAERPRLAVFRSNKQIYAQLIDDQAGRTLASAGSPTSAGDGDKKAAATRVGPQLAPKAKSAGITSVVFDRGGHQYQGRVRALAEAAREGGLDF